ncbi:MAG TPA: SPASM domain-containing protein, partial [Polyangiaceae bacterium]|nr:SPASM domain-containing protein [Polyangiaceae bacterium]
IRGGDLRTLIANLEGLAEVKRRAGKRFPYVRFVFCIMKQNFRELPLLVDLAHRCGVGEISVNNLIVYRPELAGQSVFDLGREVEEVHEEALRLALRRGIALIYKGIKPLVPKPSCAFGALAVLCDGSVGFCGAQRVLTGNIHDDTLRNLWNGPAFQTARRRYATRDYPETCRRCPNHTNSREDHEAPDMSYVAHTLAARRWGHADKAARRRLPLAGDPGSSNASQHEHGAGDCCASSDA